MDTKKLLWAYLITRGVNGKPSYYSGITIENDFRDANRILDSIGIDWNKTKAPFERDFNVFDGTDCDSQRKEYLVGELVLKNGKKLQWAAEISIVRFAGALQTIMGELGKPLYLD